VEITTLPITALISLTLGVIVLALAFTEVDHSGENHHPWRDYE